MYKKRWRKIARELRKHRCQAFVARIPSNIRYLFSSHMPQTSPMATHFIVFNDSKAVAVVPVLEAWRSENEGAEGADVHIFGKLPGVKTDSDTMMQALKSVLKEHRVKRALADSREHLRGIKFTPTTLLNEMRLIKDEAEVRCIRKACRITDKGGEILTRILKPGQSEREIQIKLNTVMKMSGGEAQAFTTTVVSGPFTAYPHHDPTARKIRSGDPVTCDFGSVYRGYCADMTRTYFVGKPSKKMREVYQIVYESYKAGVKVAKAGVRISSVDRATREVVEDYGYGKYYVHSTGHGIGLEVHEEPRISPAENRRVRAGMVFTVEPGIYIPKVGGVRIEDDVWIKGRTQNQVLNRTKIPRY